MIYNFLKNPKEYGTKKHIDRPPTLTVCQKHAITRLACLEKQRFTQIKTVRNSLCTSRSVHNILQKNSNPKYAKLWSCPQLIKLQKKLRLKFAKKHINFGSQWKDIVFSNGKKKIFIWMDQMVSPLLV